MRTMELVGKERMEVAVCPDSVGTNEQYLFVHSNNSPSGVKLATMMSQTLPTSLVS